MALKKVTEPATSVDTESDIKAAYEVIKVLTNKRKISSIEQLQLAEAHFFLATSHDLSSNYTKFHINNALTYLCKTENKDAKWARTMVHVYFCRAEINEHLEEFNAAAVDYLQCINLTLEYKLQNKISKVTLAKSGVAIADLILADEIKKTNIINQFPTDYIFLAIDYLKSIEKPNEEIFSLLSYAHQLLGLFNTFNPAVKTKINKKEYSLEQFNIALDYALKIKSSSAITLIGELYHCFYLFYQEHNCFKNKEIYRALNFIYDEVNLDNYFDDDEDIYQKYYICLDAFENFFNPYSETPNFNVLIHLIDGLNFAIKLIKNKTILNEYIIYMTKCPDQTFNPINKLTVFCERALDEYLCFIFNRTNLLKISKAYDMNAFELKYYNNKTSNIIKMF